MKIYLTGNPLHDPQTQGYCLRNTPMESEQELATPVESPVIAVCRLLVISDIEVLSRSLSQGGVLMSVAFRSWSISSRASLCFCCLSACCLAVHFNSCQLWTLQTAWSLRPISVNGSTLTLLNWRSVEPWTCLECLSWILRTTFLGGHHGLHGALSWNNQSFLSWLKTNWNQQRKHVKILVP